VNALTQSDDIEKKYEELLKLALSLDACFVNKSGGWGGLELIPEKKDEYWKTRLLFESETSKWMGDIRKAINALPANVKRSVTEQHTDYETSDVHSIVRYDNKNYGAIMGFVDEIVEAVEGRGGILSRVSAEKAMRLVGRQEGVSARRCDLRAVARGIVGESARVEVSCE